MSFFLSKEKETSLQDRPEHRAESPFSIHAMTVAYNNKPVLWDVEYDAPSGALIAIVGPNGAGKSTLIKAALGLVPSLSGVVEFWGLPYREAKSRVAYVPQRESVDWDFPVSAIDVVAMGLYQEIGWFSRVRKEHKQKALHYLKEVGLAEFADRQISQLSGGQQQRVFLARALCQEADLYFMDEPLAGVDVASEKSIFKALGQLREAGKTVCVVHHDLSSVTENFDHVILLNSRIVASGMVSEVMTEENLRKTYGGKLTVLEEVSHTLEKVGRGEFE